MEQQQNNEIKIIGVNTITNSIGDKKREMRSPPPMPKKRIGPWADCEIQSDKIEN